MEDVIMTDVNKEKESEKIKALIPQDPKANLIYLEFNKCLVLIEKSIKLKDLKALQMYFHLINKFRRGFKEEDFGVLSEIFIKNIYLFGTIKYDSTKNNFNFNPKVLELVKNLPEIIGYIFLIIITKLIDNKENEEAFKALEFLISYIKKNENLTIQFLKAKAYYYYSFISEKLGKINEIINELLTAYRSSCIQMDDITQVTLINCIIRYYLKNNAVEQARNFLSKIKYQENISTNEDARYLFYVGRIEAIQMNYSDAYKHLSNSFRKAPEKLAWGFKNIVNKLIIIVQLLMGEIPNLKNILNQNKMMDFLSFKPYLELIKAVKNGNLEEFKNVVNNYQNEFLKDNNLTLVERIRHVVIKAGLKKINLSYSRIYIKDIVEKLKLENEKEAEYILAKAISDGVFLGKINHEEGYVQSLDIKDIYSTFQPQKSYQTRIEFLNKIYNECQQAMKYSEEAAKMRENEGDLEEDEGMDRGIEQI